MFFRGFFFIFEASYTVVFFFSTSLNDVHVHDSSKVNFSVFKMDLEFKIKNENGI